VALDDVVLLVGERTRLLQDLVGRGELSDVCTSPPMASSRSRAGASPSSSPT
jgi:hypothetical protein